MVKDARAVEGPLRVIERAETALYPLINLWFILAVALALAVLLALLYRNTALKLGARWGIFLAALRLGAVAFLLLLILNPTLISRTILRTIPTLAVMMDRSASLGLSESPGGPPRADQLRQIISGSEGSLLKGFSDQYDLRPYLFDTDVAPIGLDEAASFKPDGSDTDIVGSLAKVLEDNKGRDLAGVVLFTDGRETADRESRGFMPELDYPLAVVGLGDPDSYRDVRIADVRAPDIAFSGKGFTLEAAVESVGFPAATVPVVLKRDGQVVATTSLGIDSANYRKEVDFKLSLDQLGAHTFSIEMPEQAGEAIYENNRARFKLSVVRDKIRVLMVSGTPSWNYRFFRRSLKTDPSVDLLSFVILRSAADVVNVPQYELSLIPFPMNKLFSEELGSFDLLIFDNFQFSSTIPEKHLESIRSFVENGGAFALFGGEHALGDEGIGDSPLSEILPFLSTNGTGQYVEQPVKVRLTEEGKNHPIAKLTLEGDENEELWETLPELQGYNKVSRVKDEAVVLGRYRLPDSAGDLPFLIAYKYGKGRVLTILTDDLWRWNFQMVGMKKGNTPYLNFVKQMIGWLIKDPDFNQLKVTPENVQVAPGDEVALNYHVLKDDYSPADDAALEVWAEDPSGERRDVESLPSDAPGEFKVKLRLDEVGFYKVHARASLNGELLDEGETILESRLPGSEMENGAPDHEFLRRLASASGEGRFFSAAEFREEVMRDPKGLFHAEAKERVIEEKRVRLMEQLSTFLIMVGLLSMEWYLRRRKGLI